MSFLDKILNRKKRLFEFKRNENGLHQIGGQIPNEFKMPASKFKTDFQYLGFINEKDEILKWITFKLHLVCPIYLDIDKIYLDYNNPNSPILISPKDQKKVTTAYDELNKESVITYESVKVKLEEVNKIDIFDCIGIAGEPKWLQNSETPVCPKSGKKMKFLCNLMSFGNIKTNYTNVISKYPDFNQMTFWGDGNLYVFIEPEEKTVCYFIQNT